MTAQSAARISPVVERYHTSARQYQRHWAPVLAAASARLLDFLEWYAGGPPTEPLTVVDVGTGTGTLARAALDRWPAASVIASDAAAGMLDVARESLADHAQRVSTLVGPAAELPLADASADVVVSSFVLQLVPDRRAALRECLRILRRGGVLGYVTWLDRDSRRPFRPMEEFDEAVLSLQIDESEPPPETCAGDVASAAAAARQLRRAGFRDVVAREDVLEYDWTAETYLDYKLAYDELSLIAELTRDQREQLQRDARRRLAGLPAEAFAWRPPIVFVAARKP